MSLFLNFLLHAVFTATFLLIFIVSVIIVRPFRIHRKRPKSTISLKLSYLIYLVIFLLLSYLVLFFNGKDVIEEESIEDNSFYIYYGIVIFSFIVPNLAIMLRRRIKRFRETYNVTFTIVNVITSLVLIHIISIIPWNF